MKYFATILLIFMSLIAQARTVDQVPNVQRSDSTRFVSDPDGYLSAQALARADSIARAIRLKTTAEVAVVIVEDMSGADALSYAMEIGDKWKVGKSDKDNGLIVVVGIDDRQSGIATGYGVEGILTDAIAGRIRRDILNTALADGDYDGAIVATLSAVDKIFSDPANADELISSISNEEAMRRDQESKDRLWNIYLKIALLTLIGCTAYLIYVAYKTRKLDRHDRYARLQKLSFPYFMLSVAFIGIPLVTFLALYLFKRHVRRSVPRCPNCGEKMRLIDEVHDNDYLTPAQDAEEKLGSVDYDVWHCDNCGENEISPYVNQGSKYTVCPACGARAQCAISNTIIRQPTTSAEGIGEKTYYCHNCKKNHKVAYRIAKLAAPAVAVLPGGGFGGGGGGSRGGGFGGGGFGGGGNFGGW